MSFFHLHILEELGFHLLPELTCASFCVPADESICGYYEVFRTLNGCHYSLLEHLRQLGRAPFEWYVGLIALYDHVKIFLVKTFESISDLLG